MTQEASARPYVARDGEGDAFWFLGSLMTVKAVQCDGESFAAGPGDFVLLPVGLAHTFAVGTSEPWRTLQITAPSGFEQFAAEAGEPARERRLPGAGPIDPARVGQAAARHAIELIGPPPQT